MDRPGWLDELARALDIAPLTTDDATRLLDVTRDVAHSTSRTNAPLACFLIGQFVAGRADRTLDEAMDAVRSLLPDAES